MLSSQQKRPTLFAPSETVEKEYNETDQNCNKNEVLHAEYAKRCFHKMQLFCAFFVLLGIN